MSEHPSLNPEGLGIFELEESTGIVCKNEKFGQVQLI
jgi:hypothetical protein